MIRHATPFLASALLLAATAGLHAEEYYKKPAKDPIFIGLQACTSCHDAPESGYQTANLRLTAHAKAYASLALP